MVVTETILYFIGMGLSGLRSCGLNSIDIVNKAENIFIDSYTKFILEEIPRELKQIEEKISILERKDLEEEDYKLLDKIQGTSAALLIPGDPFIATTHNSLRLAATKRGYQCKIIFNTSIISAAASISGLSSYRFGRTVTCPFPENTSEFPYKIIERNKSINAHTLVLLDIDLSLNKFLAVDEAIQILLDLEMEKSENVFTPSSIVLGIARIGYDEEFITGGVPSEVISAHNWKDIGPPQALIVCANSLHFAEEEALSTLWGVCIRDK